MARRRGRGEGSIIPLKDGGWRGQISAGVVGEKRVRHTFYGATKADVVEKMTAFRDAARAGGGGAITSRETVGAFLDRWLEVFVRRTLRAGSYDIYSRCVRNRLRPGLGEVRLDRLSPEDVHAYLARRAAEGASIHAQRHELQILKQALDRAGPVVTGGWGLIANNPANTRAVPPPAAVRRKHTTWTEEESARFLAFVRTNRPHRYAFYLVAATSGIRSSEVLGLEWRDVDFAAGTITIERAVTKQYDGPYAAAEPKTEATKRTIDLAPETAAALKEWRARDGIVRTSGIVFPARRTKSEAKRMNRSTVCTMWDLDVEASGLPPIRFHDLRHSLATTMFARGGESAVKSVQHQLGHSSPMTTLTTYVHEVKADRKSLIHEIAKNIAGGDGGKK